MKLLWNGTDIYSESCMFALNKSVNLLFDAEEIIKVETPAENIVYRENADYIFDKANNTIILTENSKIPFI